MPWTQKDRLLSVDTPLGKDVLLLTGFKGVEGISRPFNFELAMVSENHKISFEAIVGKKATVTIRLADGSERFFNGYVASFSQGRGGDKKGGDPRFSFYRATVVPGFWLHTRIANLRIFQKLSVPDILDKIIKEKGFQNLDRRLVKSYEKKEYRVQYRETDFNFISRLLEEEGIYYFFEHAKGNHTMVLADDPDKHQKCPNQTKAKYQISAGGWLEEDVITALDKKKEIRVGKYTLNDYDFEKPTANLKVEISTKHKLEPKPDKRELYDFAGRYVQYADGDRLTNIRMEEEEAQITTIMGSSVCRAFTSGYRFTLLEHYRDDMNNKDYVLTEIMHEAEQVAEYTEKSVPEGEPEFAYINHFTCIPHEIPYRPSRISARPVVGGVETAIVVGPSGEEIYTDEHGRVKVQFHWDREGKKDENSSCWIRVSQLWAGPNWGAMYIPRIGHEVIVDFIEGDPDQPIIAGRVYHGNNKPPYPLPAEKTKSTIKSNSSLGGGGFNEFRFEDKKGKEQVYMQAERNMDIRVKNDCMERIVHDRHLIVGYEKDGKKDGDQREMVYRDKHQKVHRNHTEHIGGDMQLLVGGIDGPGNQDVHIKASRKELVDGNAHEHIKGDYRGKIDGSRSLTVGGDDQSKVGMKHALDAGMEIHLKAGMKVVIEAGLQVTIKGPGGFVDVGPAGVTIQGTIVNINSGGAPGAGSGSSPQTSEDASDAAPEEPKPAGY